MRLEGRSLFDLSRSANCAPMRPHMQMIFQDPYGSLDPRDAGGADRRRAACGARAERRGRAARPRRELARGGGPRGAADADKYPHEFSGGQRQRIAIARALITRPKLVVADEPVSALDVSVQAQALNLMSDLEREAGVTFLLISHDLAVVAHICVTTAVMYRGRIVEEGPTVELFARPAHPYTRELVEATPRLDRRPNAPAAAGAPDGPALAGAAPMRDGARLPGPAAGRRRRGSRRPGREGGPPAGFRFSKGPRGGTGAPGLSGAAEINRLGAKTCPLRKPSAGLCEQTFT